ncbi:hypothetical protein AGMMS49579_05010 [Spirochaetia bacterium]|nr:hypothetical protein AGMMS49579_05010 [Spirochaetia bacterium]
MYGCHFFLTGSLEKVFPLKQPHAMKDGKTIVVFGGEVPSIQLVYFREKMPGVNAPVKNFCVALSGTPVEARLRSVELVPADFPAYETADDNYLSTEPGLFPDLLMPLTSNEIRFMPGQYRSVWIDFPGITAADAGSYPVTIRISGKENEKQLDELHVTLLVLPVNMPEQKLIQTQWFHGDCLASYYHVQPLSEAHWKILDEFIKPMAGTYGINTILTPVFTPPLDTAVGAERPTMQLVDITFDKGRYSFGFDKLERWCAICKKHGIRYLEIAHFFTQWGAKATPKIVAMVDGVEQKIFGWDVPGTDPRYRVFLEQFIPALRRALEQYGYDKKHIFFHVSDEPQKDQLEDYKAAKKQIADLVEGSRIIDALSDLEFYKEGVIEHPVTGNNHLGPFIEAKVPDLWTYYCCGQSVNVPNRFFAMPSARNRAMGVLMYRYNITGFLQWGYNFYYSQYSKKLIDPFFDTGASRAFPAGDAFLVYPGDDGKPRSSIRGEVLREAMEDMRILNLVEEKLGRDWALKIIHEDFPGEMSFEKYPLDPEYYVRLREKAAGALGF